MIGLRVALGSALLALAACGDAAEGGEGEVPVDTLFVNVLVDLQLADARAALAPDSLDLADSLRRTVLDAHALTPARLDQRLDALADAPDVARATYDAVEERLMDEQQGRLPN